MKTPEQAGEQTAPQLADLCEMMASILQQELAALSKKQDIETHDEARVKSALNCMKALKELEDMKLRCLTLKDDLSDDSEDILEFRERLQKRIEILVGNGRAE